MQKAGKLLEDYEKHSKASKIPKSQEEKVLPVLKEPDLKKVKQEPQDYQEIKERKPSEDKREKEKERKEKETKEKKEYSDPKHEKSIKPKKKNGYILYYEDMCREYKENHKGESKDQSEIDVRELSRAFSKQWRELDERMKSDYNDKAEEFNIINEAMADSVPQVRKHSIDLSDVSSDDPTPSKKKKTR